MAGSAERYAAQTQFEPIGAAGQKRIGLSQVAVVGCGAMGSAVAELLVRAGVGSLRLIDRDFVEIGNLQRQSLFDEADVAAALPKAEAAARRLRRINSGSEVEGVVADVHHQNINALCGAADLLLDGTDNLETRYLLNDFAVRNDLPWIYAGCVGAEGRVMAILPGKTACLRCMWSELPAPDALATCETAGVIGPAVQATAALQAAEALKLLTGLTQALTRRLVGINVWTSQWRSVDASRPDPACVCCAGRQFSFLSGEHAPAPVVLCGRNAVQVSRSMDAAPIDLRKLAQGLPAAARAVANEFLVRFQAGPQLVTIFADGRAIVQNTRDPALARAICARYLG